MTPTRGGFIVLHRKVLESGMWALPDSQLRVALTLLLEANWKPSVIRWGNTERILKPLKRPGKCSSDEFVEVSGEEALDDIGGRIRKVAVDEHRCHTNARRRLAA